MSTASQHICCVLEKVCLRAHDTRVLTLPKALEHRTGSWLCVSMAGQGSWKQQHGKAGNICLSYCWRQVAWSGCKTLQVAAIWAHRAFKKPQWHCCIHWKPVCKLLQGSCAASGAAAASSDLQEVCKTPSRATALWLELREHWAPPVLLQPVQCTRQK